MVNNQWHAGTRSLFYTFGRTELSHRIALFFRPFIHGRIRVGPARLASLRKLARAADADSELPLLYTLFSLVAVMYSFFLLIRFVKAHQRIAESLEAIARSKR